MYRFKFLCEISNPYTAKYAFCEVLKIWWLIISEVMTSEVLKRRAPGVLSLNDPIVVLARDSYYWQKSVWWLFKVMINSYMAGMQTGQQWYSDCIVSRSTMVKRTHTYIALNYQAMYNYAVTVISLINLIIYFTEHIFWMIDLLQGISFPSGLSNFSTEWTS